jgi:four helix bundle protein
MKKNVVREKSFDFALRIVEAYKFLCKERKEFVLSKQLLRSGTSIAANTEEADSSISRPEFSAKISIAYREARETHYWLKLLYRANYIDKKAFDSIIADCDELCKLLFSILRSSDRIRNNN